jgi:3-hydroxyisobutyrate dehydrogenase
MTIVISVVTMTTVMDKQRTMPVGFLGLGLMGQPMASRLLASGTPLLVWNRTRAKTATLRKAGSEVAPDVTTVFRRAGIVLAMLADEAALDAVLARGTPRFADLVTGHTLVHMGTTAPHYSRALATDVAAAGGRYVEAPVSGSRVPAQHGELIAMLAGDPDDVATVRPLLAPMCREVIFCGAVPSALTMKLAINLYLITTVTGLAEAMHFAQQHALNLQQFADILNAGQLASPVARVKSGKVLNGDWSAQAAVADVLKNTDLIASAARVSGTASPLLDVCRTLFQETAQLGHSRLDMVAVQRAIGARTSQARSPEPPHSDGPAVTEFRTRTRS